MVQAGTLVLLDFQDARMGPCQYDLASLGPGSYRAELRLLFRSFPPHLLRLLEELADLDPAVAGRVPTVEMKSVVVEFSVP